MVYYSFIVQLDWPIINERKILTEVSAEGMDAAWSDGWRHFGKDFYRDSISLMNGQLNRFTPLRLVLDQWSPSKSERRTLRRGEDLVCQWTEPSIRKEERKLFQKHKKRFTENVPDRLENFLGDTFKQYPCECRQLKVYEILDGTQHLIATSYLDIGKDGVSSVYAIFNPDYEHLRLGIFTMLVEMQYAKSLGKKYYYSGYATIEPSNYDYKKKFRPQEFYNWYNEWLII